VKTPEQLQSLSIKCNYRYVIAAYLVRITIPINAFSWQKAGLCNVRVDGS